MKHPLLVTSALVVLAGAALILLANPANAQSQILKLDATDVGTITPEFGTKPITITATITMPNSITSPVGVYASSIPVTIESTCPPGITVTGPATIVVPVTAADTGTNNVLKSDATTYRFASTRTVAGLKTQTCVFKATSPDYVNTQVAKGASINQPVPFTVDYYGFMTAKVGTKIQTASPQKAIPFDIILENKGNARTNVVFTLVTTNEKWNPLLPEVLSIDSVTDPSGKTTDTAVFNVNTPYRNGWNNGQQAFQIKMDTQASDAPDKQGNTLSASVLARVRGIYVPGVEPVLLMAALAGAAMVARTGKKDE